MLSKKEKKRVKKLEKAMAITALAYQEHEDEKLIAFFDLFEAEKEKLLSRPDRLQAAIELIKK